LEAAYLPYISGCPVSDALLRLYNMSAVASGTLSFLHDEGRRRRLMRIHNATLEPGSDDEFLCENGGASRSLAFTVSVHKIAIPCPPAWFDDSRMELEIPYANARRLRRVKGGAVILSRLLDFTHLPLRASLCSL
jgi:hypothetical protein